MDGTNAEVFVGVDMAKTEHYAQAISTRGVELFDRPVGNDEAVIEAMLDAAGEHPSDTIGINAGQSVFDAAGQALRLSAVQVCDLGVCPCVGGGTRVENLYW